MRRFIDDLVRISDQYNALRASPTPCPFCSSRKVKITSLMPPVQWKCRACKGRYSDATRITMKSC